MGKIYKEDRNADALTRLLKHINEGADPKSIRKKASELVANVTGKDIAAAEQNLISAGYSAKLVSQLSAAFMVMGILEGQQIDLRHKLPTNHILRKVLAEHEMALCFLADLRDVTNVISAKDDLTNTSSEFRKLAHIAQHLDAMDEHIEAEEDIIFPYLHKHGWMSLCRAASDDHTYIRVAISDLVRLIRSFNKDYFDEFKVRLSSIVSYLCVTMEEHIVEEDKILYPIALEVIKDPRVWDTIKAVCDDIGYCGLHV
jgi:DUF438 domain-containing protein